MKNRILLIISLGLFFACHNWKSPKENELEIREKKLRQSEIEYSQSIQHFPSKVLGSDIKLNPDEEAPSNSVTKYMYVVLNIVQPEISNDHVFKDQDIIDEMENRVPIMTEKRRWKNAYHTIQSEVVAIEDYNEDKKYMEIDRVKREVKQLWSVAPLIDFEAGEARREIISVEARVFSTYAEASIDKSKSE